jgi:hypothetical protein
MHSVCMYVQYIPNTPMEQRQHHQVRASLLVLKSIHTNAIDKEKSIRREKSSEKKINKLQLCLLGACMCSDAALLMCLLHHISVSWLHGLAYGDAFRKLLGSARFFPVLFLYVHHVTPPIYPIARHI